MTKKLTAALTLLFPCLIGSFANAWTYKGNGGYAVVCRNQDGSISKAELLDFYEGRILRGLSVELGEPTASLEQKVEIMLQRLEQVSPFRAQTYRLQFATFFKETRFLKDVQLADIGDAIPIAIPKNCGAEPVVNQREPEFPLDPRYVIDEEIWDELAQDDRAGLIVHELVYRELKQETSLNTRYITSLLGAREWASVGPQEWLNLAARAGFTYLEENGLPYDRNKHVRRYPSGTLKSATPMPGAVFNLHGQWVGVQSSEPVEFHESGQVRKLHITVSIKSLRPNGWGHDLGDLPSFFIWKSPYGDLRVTNPDGFPGAKERGLVFDESGRLISGALLLTPESPFILENTKYSIQVGLDWNDQLQTTPFMVDIDGRFTTLGLGKGWAWIENNRVGVQAPTSGLGLEFFAHGESLRTVSLLKEFVLQRGGDSRRVPRGHS
ncbi:MAG: hypothetical protein RBT63_08085, partial [Bdellovibrionales bacterium]|nr:hypothetical protein [Bdellovibrionales bacterium]